MPFFYRRAYSFTIQKVLDKALPTKLKAAIAPKLFSFLAAGDDVAVQPKCSPEPVLPREFRGALAAKVFSFFSVYPLGPRGLGPQRFALLPLSVGV